MDTDAYFHKLVTWRAWRQELKFKTSQELFSAHDIDTGTKFLLRTIIEAGYPPPAVALDIGCGYGPLGLMLKSLYPQGSVHLTDRDALAVDYARQNAALNNLEVVAYGSLGYDDVTRRDFDLIVANIPGKAGEPVITYLLREAQFYLKRSGIAAIVVVSPLEALVEKALVQAPGAVILLKRARSSHTVFHYRFTDNSTPPEKTAFDRGIYQRGEINIKYDGREYPLRTAYGLPEFDSLSYATQILFKALKGNKNKNIFRALLYNPGQGHVPAALWEYFHPRVITLADRDLLALRYSRLNLTANNCPDDIIKLEHTIGLKIKTETYDIITGVLRDEPDKAIRQMVERAVALVSKEGLILVSGGSTSITRLVTYLETGKTWHIKSRERWRGYSGIVMEKLDTAGKKR